MFKLKRVKKIYKFMNCLHINKVLDLPSTPTTQNNIAQVAAKNVATSS